MLGPAMQVTESDVDQAIRKMKAKRSLGPDGIPAYIYKGLREKVTAPLADVHL